ncbi:hypothetical protein JW960_04520 [candidate division KSB1 bacterium]|nr:hypothetical protein [candidate division KSB1 bacterium]
MHPKYIMPICAMIEFFSIVPDNRLSAQFIDNFDTPIIQQDSTAINGWTYYTGDGLATMDLMPRSGFASILVDATHDKRGIWWALIRRRVSADFNLARLAKPNYELRIEARIRSSHAPKRVNLHVNTQRTIDFHSQLMEFDIADTVSWHTISMTTRQFDAQPGDSIFANWL